MFLKPLLVGRRDSEVLRDSLALRPEVHLVDISGRELEVHLRVLPGKGKAFPQVFLRQQAYRFV